MEVHYQGRGATLAKVVLKSDSNEKILGEIKNMVDQKSGRLSLQAVCKIHRSCNCWLSKGEHADLLMSWLSDAHLKSHQDHKASSIELRKSIGMKVRS